MKKLQIPFKIDKQYEKWQFELDSLEDRFSGYHSYRYIGKKLNVFLNFSTSKTEFIFNGDVLTAVILTFKGKNKPSLDLLQNVLFSVGFKYKTNINSTYCYIYRKRLYCIKTTNNKTVNFVIYGKSRFIRKLNFIL